MAPTYPCLAWQFAASDEAAALRDAPELDTLRLVALDNDLEAHARHRCDGAACTFADRAIVPAPRPLAEPALARVA